MNIKSLKKPEKRLIPRYVRDLGIQSYDVDNLYPQNILRVIASSSTAMTCLKRYINFIEGYGFKDVDVSEYTVNIKGQTIDDINHLVATDIGTFKGFAIHVKYNVFCEPVAIEHVPFENCRLQEEDDSGYVANIIVHPDWTGTKTRNGKKIEVKKDSVRSIPVFNPIKEVIAAQIKSFGGIDNYPGQILWVSMDGNQYPTSICDPVITQMKTDDGLANVSMRNVCNNFLPAAVMFTRKGQAKDEYGNDIYPDNNEFEESMIQFQGDTKSNKIINIELEDGDEKPEIERFDVANYDKEFTVTNDKVKEEIYSQFDQEIFYCIRSGKLGFSGQVMKEAYEYYAGAVTKEQRAIERAFDKIFKNWYDVKMRGRNFSIQPLRYIQADGTLNNN